MSNVPYVLSVNDTISTAWHKVKGTKCSVWAAIGVIILISLGFGIIEAVTKAIFPSLLPLTRFIAQVIITLLQVGLLYIGIKRAFDLPFSWDMMFRTFDFSIALKVIGLYLLEVLIFIPIGLIFLVGIIVSNVQMSGMMLIAFLLYAIGFALSLYLAVRLVPAMAFVLDKETNSIKAFKMSFAATRGNFWPLLVLLIFQMFVILVSIVPLLGIGFIWSLPFVVILVGEIYKRLLVNVNS